MARVTIEDCLRRVESRFALVHLAVNRVLQLRRGMPLLEEAPKNKEIVLALREIAAGKITLENIQLLEEQGLLSEAALPDTPVVIQEEVMEIVEAATQPNIPIIEGEEESDLLEDDEE